MNKLGTLFLASIIMLMIAGTSNSFIDANAKHSKKTSASSSSTGSGSVTHTVKVKTHKVKTHKVKTPKKISTPTSDTSKSNTNTKTDTIGRGASGGLNGNNGQNGASGDMGGKGGKGGDKTGVITGPPEILKTPKILQPPINLPPGPVNPPGPPINTPPVNTPVNPPVQPPNNPPPVNPPACEPPKQIINNACVNPNPTPNPNPPTCKDTEVLKNGICVPKTQPPITCPTGQHLGSDGKTCEPTKPVFCVGNGLMKDGRCLPPGLYNFCYPPKRMINNHCFPPLPPMVCGSGTHLSPDRRHCVANIPNIVIHPTVRIINRDVIHRTVTIERIINGAPIQQTVTTFPIKEFTDSTNPTNVILPTVNFIDSETGVLHMVGTIVNNGDTPTKITDILVTLKDKDANILDEAHGIAVVNKLKPNESTTFEIEIVPVLFSVSMIDTGTFHIGLQ